MTAAPPPPELYRPVPVGRIGPDGLTVLVEADAAECAALASRMGLPGIAALSCRFELVPAAGGAPGGTVDATGRLEARVTQTCVVSLEDFPAHVLEDFAVRFVPAGRESGDDDPESVDEIPYENDTLDLGEAAAEQLALSLDPYPRKPGAVLPGHAGSTVDPRLAGLAAWRGGQRQ